MRLTNCKLPNGYLVGPTASATVTGPRIELINCTSAAVNANYISEVHTPFAALTTETSITLVGGLALGGTQVISFKIVTTANSNKYFKTLDGFPITKYIATTGSPITVTVEIISSAALNTDEFFIDFSYLGDSGSPLGTFISSAPAQPLAAGVAIATSTASWNALPATPVKQKVQFTFTPRKAGLIQGIPRLGKPSTTMYYNPSFT